MRTGRPRRPTTITTTGKSPRKPSTKHQESCHRKRQKTTCTRWWDTCLRRCQSPAAGRRDTEHLTDSFLLCQRRTVTDDRPCTHRTPRPRRPGPRKTTSQKATGTIPEILTPMYLRDSLFHRHPCQRSSPAGFRISSIISPHAVVCLEVKQHSMY